MSLDAIAPGFTTLEFIPTGRDCVPTLPLDVEDRVVFIPHGERLPVDDRDGVENE